MIHMASTGPRQAATVISTSTKPTTSSLTSFRMMDLVRTTISLEDFSQGGTVVKEAKEVAVSEVVLLGVSDSLLQCLTMTISSKEYLAVLVEAEGSMEI